jgi:hypothetical protein
MLCRRLALGEDARAFERDVDPELPPRQLGRIALGSDADFAAPGVKPVLASRNFVRLATVHSVIAEQVRIGFDRAEIVDADDLDLAARMLHRRAEDQPPNAAKTVDRHPYRHGSPS